MKSFLFLILIFSSSPIFCQSSDIIGTWKYESVYEKETLKDKELNKADELFSDLIFYIKKEDTYISVSMGKVEEGTWVLDSTNKFLKLIAANGKSQEIDIIELKGDALIIHYHKMSIILKRQK